MPSSELDGPRCWRAGDMNLLKVPQNLTDDQVVLLSDVLPTSWCVASSISMSRREYCIEGFKSSRYIYNEAGWVQC